MRGHKCIYCSSDLDGTVSMNVSNGDYCHAFCYYKHHPFQKRKTFREVLANHDDTVLVFDLLQNLVPDIIQEKVIEAFNQIMNERRTLRNHKYFEHD